MWADSVSSEARCRLLDMISLIQTHTLTHTQTHTHSRKGKTSRKALMYDLTVHLSFSHVGHLCMWGATAHQVVMREKHTERLINWTHWSIYLFCKLLALLRGKGLGPVAVFKSTAFIWMVPNCQRTVDANGGAKTMRDRQQDITQHSTVIQSHTCKQSLHYGMDVAFPRFTSRLLLPKIKRVAVLW